MLKLIDIDEDFFKDEPVIRVIHPSGAIEKGIEKQAADSRISEFASKIVPDPDKIYVHILAMGAGEFYGANRNADYFPEENLKAYYKTFETSPAHIFRHHINKNPEIAIGKVVFAIYNERMHRVEVIAWIDRKKGSDIVEKIEKGEFPYTSMACITPYDECSICGNKARSRSEYCSHLSNELGKLYPDGRKVMALNTAPLKFFDMSQVIRPADVTSSVLQKVASDVEMPAHSSAYSAEVMGLVEKAASMRKVSELIKEVEGEIAGHGASLAEVLGKVRDPDDEILNYLSYYSLDHVLHAFAELGISPSVGYLAKLIGQKIAKEPVPGIDELVNKLIKEDADMVQIPHLPIPDSVEDAPTILVQKLAPFSKQASLVPDFAVQRAITAAHGTVYGPTGSSRSYGQGPVLHPLPKESYEAGMKAVNPDLSLRELIGSENFQGMLATLAHISGLAVAAKWLLTKLIESKALDSAKKQTPEANHAVKIVLVKSASDAVAITKMAKASLLRDLRGEI